MQRVTLPSTLNDRRDQDFEHGGISLHDGLVDSMGSEAKQSNGFDSAAVNQSTSSVSQARLNVDDFIFISKIGLGSSSKIMLAEYKQSKRIYAIKILKKERLIECEETILAMRERPILKLATEENHPFIVRLFATFQTRTRLYFVMEYIPGGDLMWNLQQRPFSQEQAKFYAAEVCLALKYLHSKGILYRDMRLDNIMLAHDGHIKVIDFGICAEDMRYGTTTSTFCGNAEFMAPEILLDQKYSFAVDWWAFGILIFKMSFRRAPFAGEDEDEIYDAILSDEPLYPANSPPNTKAICQALLIRKPEQRLGSGATDAQELLVHPYFSGINWDDLYYKRVVVPYKPALSGEKDISNFDTDLTGATTALTPVRSVLSESAQAEFKGFSGSYQEL